ncbi:hypothetical protein G7054_g9976 [Neopestalotiopsis clavispora]|nr:hypothetical protein G7054_g9976 [Neopestalotiopsis clavispora]
MAPSKGGQAAKQQPQKQHQQTTTSSRSAASVPASQAVSAIAKKPPAPTAAAAIVSRPAVVPAIPLPMIRRQTSNTKKIIGGGSNNSSNGSGNANNATSNRLNGNHDASRHVPSATSTSRRPPVASLEAALIDQQTAAAATTAADDSGTHRQRPRRSKQNELKVNANGTHVEKPGLAAATNNVHHNGDHGNSSHYRNGLHSSTANGTADTTGSNGHRPIPENEHAVGTEHLTNGFANFALSDNLNNPTSASSSAFVHASNAPSTVGDFEVSANLAQRQLSNGNAHFYRQYQLVFSAYHNTSKKRQTNSPSSGAPNEATAITPSYQVDSLGNSTDPYVSSHPIFPANGNDTASHHVPHHATFHAQHYAHANGAGVMFGGVPTPDSHTPSPASGAFMPPPLHGPLLGGVPGDGHKFMPPNGQHAHTGLVETHGTNYAAPMTPLRPGPDSMTSIDSYAPIPAPLPGHRGPMDGYPPNGSHFEPPTPHSFHGSHASGDFSGPDNIAPFRPNGHGFDRDPRNSHSHGVHSMPPFVAPQHFPRPPNLDAELMESVMFFQAQFNSAELTDCTLELDFCDHTQPPAKINAHKLILARSPTLKQSIMITRASDPGSHVITVNAPDRHLTSDSWFMAVQRLYLHPLFTPPFNVNGNDFGMVNITQFRFCLGYAAAGHFLEMKDVLLRGLQIAADMVHWHTIEEGLSFALQDAKHRHFTGEDGTEYTDVDFAYGRDVRILMMSITSFLINQFPSNFKLDTTVTDMSGFSRIPAAAYDSIAESAPAIARGTSVRKLTKSNRLSAIKFGDLPAEVPEEVAGAGAGATSREPAKCSALLSRILLNLPFEDLRYVLASESIHSQAWNTAQDRYHALTLVVAEREARRLRAVEAVRARVVPSSSEIKRRLSAPRRHDVADAWDVLNWQEKVIQPNGAGLPNLVRNWVPQFGTPDEAPQLPTYEPRYHESMV